MTGKEKLESRIGYQFSDSDLLEQALTHRSYSGKNNERLEFLGDSVLNFAIALQLYHKFPEADEGQLSRLRARMVKQSTLADIARELDLGPLLLMGSGELKSGGFDRDSILSDGVEAMLGAIRLDANYGEAEACVVRLYATRLDQLDATDLKKDAKSRLQEYLQSEGRAVPEYEVTAIKGKSPNQEFEVQCHSDGVDPVTAKGKSKRKAEQAAAAIVLQRLGVDGE